MNKVPLDVYGTCLPANNVFQNGERGKYMEFSVETLLRPKAVTQQHREYSYHFEDLRKSFRLAASETEKGTRININFGLIYFEIFFFFSVMIRIGEGERH